MLMLAKKTKGHMISNHLMIINGLTHWTVVGNGEDAVSIT